MKIKKKNKWSNQYSFICSIGPKYVVSERKEFAENLNFKEENSSRLGTSTDCC